MIKRDHPFSGSIRAQEVRGYARFLRCLVPPYSALFNYAQCCLEKIPPTSEVKFGLKDKPKALLHTWLAWQKNPGRPYGTAITEKYLDNPHAQEADLFLDWFKRHFQI